MFRITISPDRQDDFYFSLSIVGDWYTAKQILSTILK
jgi:hypothetical protein